MVEDQEAVAAMTIALDMVVSNIVRSSICV